MRVICVLLFTVCLAVAYPQTGYNYEPANFQLNAVQPQLQQVAAYAPQEQLQTLPQFNGVGAPIEHSSYTTSQQISSVPFTESFGAHGSHETLQFDQHFPSQPAFSSDAAKIPADFSLSARNFEQGTSTGAAYTGFQANSPADFTHQQFPSQQSHLSQSNEGIANDVQSFQIHNSHSFGTGSGVSSAENADAISVDAPPTAPAAPAPQPNHQASFSPSAETASAQNFGAPESNFGASGPNFGAPEHNVQNALPAQPQAAPIHTTNVQKHIYVHVPPPDFEEPESQPQILSAPVTNKRHYKILFIKAPTVRQPKVIAPAQSIHEEKTLVYVLVKKPDQVQEFIQQAPAEAKRDKPEVYFIKYNTQKEVIGASEAAPPSLPVAGESLPAPIESSNLSEPLIDERSNAPQLPAFEPAADQSADSLEPSDEIHAPPPPAPQIDTLPAKSTYPANVQLPIPQQSSAPQPSRKYVPSN